MSFRRFWMKEFILKEGRVRGNKRNTYITKSSSSSSFGDVCWFHLSYLGGDRLSFCLLFFAGRFLFPLRSQEYGTMVFHLRILMVIISRSLSLVFFGTFSYSFTISGIWKDGITEEQAPGYFYRRVDPKVVGYGFNRPVVIDGRITGRDHVCRYIQCEVFGFGWVLAPLRLRSRVEQLLGDILYVLMLGSSIVARLFWRVVIVTVASSGLLQFRFICIQLGWMVSPHFFHCDWGWFGIDIPLTNDDTQVWYVIRVDVMKFNCSAIVLKGSYCYGCFLRVASVSIHPIFQFFKLDFGWVSPHLRHTCEPVRMAGNDIPLTDDAARILYDTILYYADDDDERIDVKRLKTWPFGAALLSRRVIVRCGTLQADQCMVGWMSSFSLQVRCWQIIVHWWW